MSEEFPGQEYTPANEDEKSWHEAQRRAKSLLPIHTLFSNSIRFLNGSLPHKGEIKNISPLMILLSSPKIRVLLYFACTHLTPEKLSTDQDLTPLELVDKLGAETLCSLLAIRYLTRRVEEQSEEKIWLVLSQEFRAQMQIGIQVGRQIPDLGIARGLLAGGIRTLALAVLAKKDLKAFRQYRRAIHKKNVLFDIPTEMTLWGCNHLQISAILLQSFGFGLSAAKGLGVGLYPNSALDHILDDSGKQWRDAALWIDALITLEAPPDELKQKYGLETQEIFKKIQSHIEKQGADITAIPWLDGDPATLSDDIRSQLQLESKEKAKAVTESAPSGKDIDTILS